MNDDQLQKMLKQSLHHNEEFWTMNTQSRVHGRLGPTQRLAPASKRLSLNQRILLNLILLTSGATILFYGVRVWLQVLKHIK